MRRGLIRLALAALLTAGCGQETTGVTASDYQRQRQALVAKQRRRAVKAASVAEAPKEGLSDLGSFDLAFTYDPTDKRDPFRSFILDRLQELDAGTRGPLEQFDLSQLEVVAVIWGIRNRRALVEDPSGRGYVVEEGTAIGKNEGKVTRIEDNRVVVRETYVDYLGARTTKEIEMRVHPVSGG